MNCNICNPTWFVYKSYFDKKENDSGIYYTQYLPLDNADKIYSIYEKKRNEAYLRNEVNKIPNISEEEKENILKELLEKC